MSDNKHTTVEPVETEPPKRARAKRRGWLAVLLLVLITGVLVLPLYMHRQNQGPPGMGGPPGPGGPPPGMGNGPVMIQTATVTARPMNVYLDAIGTVTPEHTANLYSQVSGRVLAVNYQEGQMVHAGQSLVEIDPEPYQALLAQARGALARDRAMLEQARVNAKRYEDAFSKNALSQQTVFDQQSTVKQYEGTVQNDEGSVRYDEVQLSYCHIVAPFDGRIGLRLVDPGNTIFAGASNTLAVITQLDPITVVFSVAEDHVPTVLAQLRKKGTMKVDLYDRAQSTRITSGKLLTLDNQIDTTTGTVKFRAEFRNPNGTVLFPNQFVNARLLVDTVNSALQLPTSAIQYNGQQAFVYVVNQDQTLSIKNIKVTNENDNGSAVEGLTAGTVVAASNFDRLEDGGKVALAPARPPAGGPSPPGPGTTPKPSGRS